MTLTRTRRSSPELTAPMAAVAGILLSSQAVLSVRAGELSYRSVVSFQPALEVVVLLMVPAALAFFTWQRIVGKRTSLTVLLFIFAAGALMRLMHFGGPVIAETDHFRYLWDGALVAHGFDPYARSPDFFTASGASLDGPLAKLAAEGHDVLSRINFPDLRTIYPATAQALFALGHLIAPFDIDGLRIILFGADLATLALLLIMLRRARRSPWWAAAFWLNPLAIFVTANQAHVDAALAPLLLAALLAADLNRGALSGAFLALAAGVKIWPMLLLPLLVRRLGPDLRRAGAALLVFGVIGVIAMFPLLLSALQPGSGLAAYAARWANNNGIYAWLSWSLWTIAPTTVPTELLLRSTLALAAGLTAVAVAIRQLRTFDDLMVRALIVAAAVFYLSPAQFPWYSLWFLPLAAIAGSLPLVFATVLLPIYFLFFPLAEVGERDVFLYGISLLHAVPVLVWLAVDYRTAKGPGP